MLMVFVLHLTQLLCHWPLLQREDSSMQSWWITGKKQCCDFYILFKSSIRGQVKLQKMAGDLMDRICSMGVLGYRASCLVI